VKIDATCIYLAAPGGTLQAMVKEDPNEVYAILLAHREQDRGAQFTGLEGKPVMLTAQGVESVLAVWGVTAEITDPRLAIARPATGNGPGRG
jgi:hypothetical protein